MSKPTRPRTPVSYIYGFEDPMRHEPIPPHHAPPVDIVEEGAGWRLVFEVPGAITEKMSIDVRGKRIVVRGERRATEGECGRFLRVERAAGPFERTVELPDDADPEHAVAAYADGLLTIEIPRAARPKSRTIPIQDQKKAT